VTIENTVAAAAMSGTSAVSAIQHASPCGLLRHSPAVRKAVLCFAIRKNTVGVMSTIEGMIKRHAHCSIYFIGPYLASFRTFPSKGEIAYAAKNMGRQQNRPQGHR
jgi:hypothetical protein